MMGDVYVIGVDVGTASCRAGLVDITNTTVNSPPIITATRELKRRNPQPKYYEQSMTDIWCRVCECVQEVIERAKIVDVTCIRGISFDATCSLVIFDHQMQPLSITTNNNHNNDDDDDDVYNIIMWMDHRAEEEAATINAQAHAVLECVGGRISPEMEPPKLMWLKKHHPQWTTHLYACMDLADALVYYACGVQDVRSSCTTTCKWLYQNHDGEWCDDFYRSIGLEDCLNTQRMTGGRIQPISSPIATITPTAASTLGLSTQCMVATGLIDAHAGGVGVLGVGNREFPASLAAIPLHQRLAVIAGTSTCYMLATPQRVSVPGVWGPYYEAMLHGHWLLEAGQSATGSFVDDIITSHPAYTQIIQQLPTDTTIYEWLEQRLCTMVGDDNNGMMMLTRNRHLTPDFLGNRSPLADPQMTGVVCGRTLQSSTFHDMANDLAVWYLAALQAVALGTRHIIDHISEHYRDGIRMLCVCGGLAHSSLFLQIHADACQLPVVLTTQPDASVLLGSAMCAAAAATGQPLSVCMSQMTAFQTAYHPNQQLQRYYDAKFMVLKRMRETEQEYRRYFE